MTRHEHGTLVVTITDGRPGRIDVLTSGGDEAVSPGSAGLRHQMHALDLLSAAGWDLLGPPAVTSSQGGLLKEYLLRRPRGQDGEVPQT